MLLVNVSQPLVNVSQRLVNAYILKVNDLCVSSLRMGHTKRIEAAVQQCRLDSERTITGIKGFELIPKPSSEFEMVIELARTND